MMDGIGKAARSAFTTPNLGSFYNINADTRRRKKEIDELNKGLGENVLLKRISGWKYNPPE